MKESDYIYWHKLASTERPDEMPNGCEFQGSTGWKTECTDPALWGYLLRRWPKAQTPPAPKMRAMTRKEVLEWASSADAFGWVVHCEDTGAIGAPPAYNYNDHWVFTRARIDTLNDDGTGGEWKAFEVEL